MLTLEDVCLSLPHRDGERELLRGINLEVEAGESVGLVGESGSGKSMTLRTVMRTQPKGSVVRGRVLVDGHDVTSMSSSELRKVRSEQVASISQDPTAALNPVLTVTQFLVEGLCDARGVPRDEAEATVRKLLDRVGIKDLDRCMSAYPHQLSGGMLQRVVIAAAVAGSPSLLLADEPTTALDVTTQAEVAAILDEQRRDLGMAMVFVTHDVELAAAVCDRIAVLYAGEIVELAAPETLHDSPNHPYTRLLLDSRPTLSSATTTRLPVVPGQPRAAYEVGDECAFSDRCPWAIDACTEHAVPWDEHDGHGSRCLRSDDLADELSGSESRGDEAQLDVGRAR